MNKGFFSKLRPIWSFKNILILGVLTPIAGLLLHIIFPVLISSSLLSFAASWYELAFFLSLFYLIVSLALRVRPQTRIGKGSQTLGKRPTIRMGIAGMVLVFVAHFFFRFLCGWFGVDY